MSNIKSIFSTVVIHTAIWLFLLLLPVMSVAPFIAARQIDFSQNYYIMLSYSSIVLIIVFYTNYLYLFPKFYLNRRQFTYFCLAILTILLVVILTRLTMYGHFRLRFISFAIFRLLLAFFLSSALVVYERWQKTEKERLFAEVNFLKAQINPHFLFNTLNGIYTLVLKKSDKAAEAISKLSALMQYVATDAANTSVSLKNEISYISNYIELQKLRLTTTTKVNFSVTGNADSFQIEPLLLITFIENAFKFGVSTEKTSVIQIDITIEENQLNLFVKNQKGQNIRTEKKSGIGLENTLNRLKINYPNSHTLNIDETDTSFTVNLAIKLK